MSPENMSSAADWIAWALSPEHFAIAIVAAVIGLGIVLAMGLVIERLWRQANERLDDAAEPATASRTDWWLCPLCGSLNRPSQHCYKGCATTDGPILPSKIEQG